MTIVISETESEWPDHSEVYGQWVGNPNEKGSLHYDKNVKGGEADRVPVYNRQSSEECSPQTVVFSIDTCFLLHLARGHGDIMKTYLTSG